MKRCRDCKWMINFYREEEQKQDGICNRHAPVILNVGFSHDSHKRGFQPIVGSECLACGDFEQYRDGNND